MIIILIAILGLVIGCFLYMGLFIKSDPDRAAMFLLLAIFIFVGAILIGNNIK